MSIISTQIPEEIANAIKCKAESMDVTPSWLVRKIIKFYIHQAPFLDPQDPLNPQDIKDTQDTEDTADIEDLENIPKP